MLGLIKFLAFTAMILNHQSNANHCHTKYTCTRRGKEQGTQFKLKIKGQGSDEGDYFIGKLTTSTYLQINPKRFLFLVARGDLGKRYVIHQEVDDDLEPELFTEEEEFKLIFLSPCDDFHLGHLEEWFQVCVCYHESVCNKQRLVYKKG